MSKTGIRQFVKEVVNSQTGVKTKYFFDYNIDSTSPIGSETEYPEVFTSDFEEEQKLPVTKRTFYNPATQTFVGYGRALQLKLDVYANAE